VRGPAYCVGKTTRLWVDKSRRSWLLKNKSAKLGEHRKLMANVWYPAAPPVVGADTSDDQCGARSSTTLCIGARHVIHDIVYRCSPHHPPHSVPVLATSSTTQCTGARHVIL